jgi:hypothetical protein
MLRLRDTQFGSWQAIDLRIACAAAQPHRPPDKCTPAGPFEMRSWGEHSLQGLCWILWELRVRAMMHQTTCRLPGSGFVAVRSCGIHSDSIVSEDSINPTTAPLPSWSDGTLLDWCRHAAWWWC